MADTVKKKVIDIETGSAVKNVNELTSSFTPLSRQIKDLKNQLAQLEQGTAEYNQVAKQLADTQQRQIEITEAAKYSNKDFGQTLSNVAAVSAGVVGGINAISSVMTMLGADSEKAQEAMKNIQLTMAVVQGLGAMDTAVKAIRGLNLAFAANTVATKSFQDHEGCNGYMGCCHHRRHHSHHYVGQETQGRAGGFKGDESTDRIVLRWSILCSNRGHCKV